MNDLLSPVSNGPLKEGLLQRLDPRLKLLLLLLLVISIFSARNFSVLVVVGTLAAGLLTWQPATLRPFLQRLSYLRWLLLFTLLLHLLLTPGRTLFGLRMLSYDGLLRGLMVDVQLVLALFFTWCFALTTAPAAVAWGVTRLLGPLRRLGFPVSETGGLLVLVLHFLPQVFQLGAPLVQGIRQQKARGMVEYLQQLVRSIADAVLVLIEQADIVAGEICRGESSLLQDQTDFRWQKTDSLWLAFGFLFAVICGSL